MWFWEAEPRETPFEAKGVGWRAHLRVVVEVDIDIMRAGFLVTEFRDAFAGGWSADGPGGEAIGPGSDGLPAVATGVEFA